MNQNSVFKGAGLHFIGVANDISRKGRVGGHASELHSDWKCSAAAPQQVGILNHLLDAPFTVLADSRFQTLIPTAVFVFFQCGNPVRLAVFK